MIEALLTDRIDLYRKTGNNGSTWGNENLPGAIGLEVPAKVFDVSGRREWDKSRDTKIKTISVYFKWLGPWPVQIDEIGHEGRRYRVARCARLGGKPGIVKAEALSG